MEGFLLPLPEFAHVLRCDRLLAEGYPNLLAEAGKTEHLQRWMCRMLLSEECASVCNPRDPCFSGLGFQHEPAQLPRRVADVPESERRGDVPVRAVLEKRMPLTGADKATVGRT